MREKSIAPSLENVGGDWRSRLYARQTAEECDQILQLIGLGFYGRHQRLLLFRDARNFIERERMETALQILQGDIETRPASRESAECFAHRAD